jgi:hypothetical protein
LCGCLLAGVHTENGGGEGDGGLRIRKLAQKTDCGSLVVEVSVSQRYLDLLEKARFWFSAGIKGWVSSRALAWKGTRT